jgi:hypothetical protein
MPRTITQTVYTIEDHPNLEKVFDWIRDHWHDLGDFALQEMVESLEAFAAHIGAYVDYSLSIAPDRGEFVRFITESDKKNMFKGLDLSGNCPLTGMCYDEDILDAIREAKPEDSLSDILADIEYRVLKTLHDEGRYIYSEEGLREMCEANEYEFLESGEMV